MTMIETTTLQAALPEYFAPWVQALDLRVQPWAQTDAGRVKLLLPNSPQLSRVGGMLCGQAMMAAADTAVVLALMAHFGQFRPCTTVQMSTSFLKPLSNDDALITAQVIRAGKSTAFVEVDIAAARSGASVCRASAVYALM
jgi:uncharacterized protein (TIGR00369 family)